VSRQRNRSMMDGPDLSTGTDPLTLINAASRAFPNATNAQALAACETLMEWDSADSGAKAGIPADAAQAFLMPDGILPRMRFLACGWVNPGDRFKSPTDSGWWGKAYGRPLWEPLRTYAKLLKSARAGQDTFRWNDKLSEGDAAELSQSMLAASSELVAITNMGHDVCAPFLIPRVDDVMPQPNAPCLVRLGIEDKRKERDKERKERKEEKQSEQTKTKATVLLLLGVAYIVAFHFKHGRAPWS
jgi:hypothetical protein